MSLNDTLYIGTSGLTTHADALGIVGDNIANASTVGFKRSRAEFSDLLGGQLGEQRLGGGVRLGGSETMFDQGAIMQTGNPLDMAIQGNGFFVVQTPQGPRYTRLGHFSLNAAGQLVNKQGYPVLGGGAPITINPDDGPVQIAADGTVSADRTQQGNAQVIYGKIDVVDFQNREQLKPEEGLLFNTNTAPIQVAQPALAQRMLEQSNVQPVKELTSMIWVQRNYEAVEKFIEGEDDRMRRAVNYIIPSSS